ncbi:MAG: hypothetical protein NVS3B1_20440 [Marmoricola sp.]
MITGPIVLTPKQVDWVRWLRKPVGTCPHSPIGRAAGWTTAVKVAAGEISAVNDPRHEVR